MAETKVGIGAGVGAIAATPGWSRADPPKLVVMVEDRGGRLAVVETRERRGQGPPLHAHTREDELIYVLEGEVTFHKGGQLLVCPVGTSVLLLRGCEHTYRVESDEARLLVVLAPAGLEGLYRELGDQDGQPDAELLITVAARYGIEITGPCAINSLGEHPRATDGGGDRRDKED